MTAFLDDYDALADKGERRWQSWFGGDSDSVSGPFNLQCSAHGYGPPVTRTCIDWAMGGSQAASITTDVSTGSTVR